MRLVWANQCTLAARDDQQRDAPMRVPGRKALTRALRFARSRLSPGIVVLGYHRLGDPADDPFDLCIAPSDFQEHLAAVVRHTHPLTLGDAVRALVSDQIPSRAVVLTFDDGYADTLVNVLPLLERSAIPATVFVTSGGRGRQFWWDELAGLLLDGNSVPEQLELRIRGSRRVWSLRPATAGPASVDASARVSALRAIAGELRGLGAGELDEQMGQLREWSGRQPTACGPHRSLTETEIHALSQSPLIEIGAHTVSHPDLTALRSVDQDHEIAQSRAALEAITGGPVTSFSYPHGRYSDVTVSAVRRAGFTVACCSRPDVARARCDALCLPRMWIQPREAGKFERWLERWLVH